MYRHILCLFCERKLGEPGSHSQTVVNGNETRMEVEWNAEVHTLYSLECLASASSKGLEEREAYA